MFGRNVPVLGRPCSYSEMDAQTATLSEKARGLGERREALRNGLKWAWAWQVYSGNGMEDGVTKKVALEGAVGEDLGEA